MIGNPGSHLLDAPGRIEQEGASLPDPFQDIVLGQECRIMTGNKVRLGQQIRRLDPLRRKPEMGYGDPA